MAADRMWIIQPILVTSYLRLKERGKAMLTRVIMLTIGLTIGFLPVIAEGREDVRGLWASDESILSVYEEDGQLHGQVIAVMDPVYTIKEDVDRAGQHRLDDNNPEKTLKERPIIGLQIFSEYQYDGSKWRGKIYDPESGNTYQSRMKINRDGRLEIRGYIGVPLFGRTAQFDPVSSCLEHIVKMLAMTERSDICPGKL